MDNEETHYPVMPGMELPHNIKVEVHKGELEHLKRLADTAISDFTRLEEENAVLRKMLTAFQREHATGSMWISMEEREPTEKDGNLLLMWEDGMLDWGEYNSDVNNIVTHSDRCLDVQTGDEGHSIEWWMPRWVPLPPYSAKIDPPLAVPSKEPKEAYAVVIKMMDSHCLVGGKIFMKEADAEKFRQHAINKSEKMLDTVKVGVYESYEPPEA